MLAKKQSKITEKPFGVSSAEALCFLRYLLFQIRRGVDGPECDRILSARQAISANLGPLFPRSISWNSVLLFGILPGQPEFFYAKVSP